jgi:translation initiation factor IF-3
MKPSDRNAHLINETIRFPQVRVVAEEGFLGAMSSRDALDLARERQLDLVLLNDKTDPPVCRIVDYGKFRYEQEKQQRKPAHKPKLKELKMRYTIEDHDYSVRISQAKRFLQSGDQVKASIVMRGRENQHIDLAEALLKKMAAELQDIAQVQQAPTREGSRMQMLLVPKTAKPKPEA